MGKHVSDPLVDPVKTATTPAEAGSRGRFGVSATPEC
jgi:hypothetical protein